MDEWMDGWAGDYTRGSNKRKGQCVFYTRTGDVDGMHTWMDGWVTENTRCRNKRRVGVGLPTENGW